MIKELIATSAILFNFNAPIKKAVASSVKSINDYVSFSYNREEFLRVADYVYEHEAVISDFTHSSNGVDPETPLRVEYGIIYQMDDSSGDEYVRYYVDYITDGGTRRHSISIVYDYTLKSFDEETVVSSAQDLCFYFNSIENQSHYQFKYNYAFDYLVALGFANVGGITYNVSRLSHWNYTNGNLLATTIPLAEINTRNYIIKNGLFSLNGKLYNDLYIQFTYVSHYTYDGKEFLTYPELTGLYAGINVVARNSYYGYKVSLTQNEMVSHSNGSNNTYQEYILVGKTVYLTDVNSIMKIYYIDNYTVRDSIWYKDTDYAYLFNAKNYVSIVADNSNVQIVDTLNLVGTVVNGTMDAMWSKYVLPGITIGALVSIPLVASILIVLIRMLAK